MALRRTRVLLEEAVSVATSASRSSAESSKADVTARLSARALRDVRGEVNMPSRAIAAALLRAEGPQENRRLFEAAEEYGFLTSYSHFKKVLGMMKKQGRVVVERIPAERGNLSKMSFAARLTRRGQKIYTEYLGEDVPLPKPQSRGLADAQKVAEAA